MTETPYPAAERLGTDLSLDAAYQPATYPGTKTGPGSWVTLQSGEQELGVLWVSDAEGIGFIPTTPAGILRVAELYPAFSRAAALGTPARDVFDHYAGMASQGLSAGPVEHGDLDTLVE